MCLTKAWCFCCFAHYVLSEIKIYLSSNFLRLNEHEHYSLGALSKNVCNEPCNLGVYRFILDVSNINLCHAITV